MPNPSSLDGRSPLAVTSPPLSGGSPSAAVPTEFVVAPALRGATPPSPCRSLLHTPSHVAGDVNSDPFSPMPPPTSSRTRKPKLRLPGSSTPPLGQEQPFSRLCQIGRLAVNRSPANLAISTLRSRVTSQTWRGDIGDQETRASIRPVAVHVCVIADLCVMCDHLCMRRYVRREAAPRWLRGVAH